MKNVITLLIFTTFSYLHSRCQVRWSGAAGDGQWNSAGNWQAGQVPAPGDDVLIDNSLLAGNYKIYLPAGNTRISIRSLTIKPSTTSTIEVILPVGNISLPGIDLSSTTTSLAIYAGGIFRNSSGAGSGVSVKIAGLVAIYNEGKYVHNTPISHANIVAALSTALGTETGIFEFDIKGGSPLVSVSGRTFGSLTFSALANGATKTYNINGNNRAMIRGNLVIGNLANVNLALDDTVFVMGNYIQQGGMLNMGSAPYNTVLRIAKDLVQTGGYITEKDEGLPVIELAGNSVQYLSGVTGGFTNSLTVKINNVEGVILQTPLSLPYSLHLAAGRVVTSASTLLTLQASCGIIADSLTAGVFLDGPVRKEGLSATPEFRFPVGKGNAQRWLSLINATGDYTVEFHRGNPGSISGAIPASLHHISKIEYWSVDAPIGSSQARVKLSFNDPNSGGVTDMQTLRVAQMAAASWLDLGNWQYQGTPGSNGFVISQPVSVSGTGQQYFTLASTSASLNPLLLESRARPAGAERFQFSGRVVPSVTSGSAQLIITSAKKIQVQFQVVNMAGNICHTITAHLQQGINRIYLNLAQLSAGMYRIHAITPTGHMKPVALIRQ